MKSDRFRILKRAVIEAGDKMASMSSSKNVREKSSKWDIVTAGDKASEAVLIAHISKHYPDDDILSEETASTLTSDQIRNAANIWVLDPIDGTYNYRYNQNYSCVSAAYVSRGNAQIAIAYNPFTKELYHAKRCGGSFLNGKKLLVQSVESLSDSSIATDQSNFIEEMAVNLSLISKSLKTPKVYIKGSAVLAISEVAAGRIGLYFQTILKPWDNAAAILIAHEAGAVATNLAGDPIDFLSPEVVVGNKLLVKEFVSLIR